MAKGDSKVTQESTFKPSPEQEALLKLALPYAKQFAENPPQSPRESQIVGFNPIQKAGQQRILDASVGMQDIADSARKSGQFLLSPDMLDPMTNPYLMRTIQAATDPIVRNATERLLPNIRGDAVTSGQYDSTKRTQTEQQLASDTMRQVGDTGATIASNLYGENLGAMTKMQALAPTLQQTQLAPGMAIGGVGDLNQMLAQQQRSEQYQQNRMAESWPLVIAQEILGTSSMFPGGTNVSTATQNTNNTFGSILGGLMTGASVLPSLLKLF